MFTLETMKIEILSATTHVLMVEPMSIEIANSKGITAFITQQLVATSLTVGQIWPRSQ